jgi:hypothetical protein
VLAYFISPFVKRPLLERLQLHRVDVRGGEHLFLGGIQLLQVRRADEALEQCDVRRVRRVQGEIRLQQDVDGLTPPISFAAAESFDATAIPAQRMTRNGEKKSDEPPRLNKTRTKEPMRTSRDC